MIQWHVFEVDRLDQRPDHPILCQYRGVCAPELISWVFSLHHCHTAQENEKIGRGEDGLISEDTSGNGEIVIWKDDAFLEEFIPEGCRRTENTWIQNLALRRTI